MDDLSNLLVGWYVSDPNRAAQLLRELMLELPPDHLLDGRALAVVAHREATDDILCRHSAEPERHTVIHLSWLGRQEIDSRHPWVEADGTFDDFLAYEARFLAGK